MSAPPSSPRSRRLAPSFRSLLTVAFLLAALPLVGALVESVISLERLSREARQAVTQAAAGARASRQLADQALTLERIARQVQILDDASLLADYRTVRQRFKATSSELALLPLSEAQLATLNQAVETEQTLFARLSDAAEEGVKAASLVEGYRRLSDSATQLLAASNEINDREVARLGTLATDTERQLWWRLTAMIGLSLTGAALASWLVARPLKALGQAVRRLGEGDFTRPVAVSGPADFEELGRRLEWTRQRLEELESQKQRLLRHVSHELKTPLTALREGAALLKEGALGPLNPAQGEVVGILDDQSRQLQALIERFLDYQRALQDLGRVELAPLDLADPVHTAVESHRLAAQARGVAFVLDEAAAPLRVRGDADKLATVVDNLLSNAVKYSPAGGRVLVRLTARDGAAVLEVCDQGPGIAAEARDQVFQWFYRGAPGHSALAGSGLGLAIARELAEAQGGRLVLGEPRLPDYPGAAFSLTLPRLTE
ncbi:two-component system, NtrC family, sensor histidine kinase GlrK [Oryzomicrobium terrae]|uniref:Signal transduction histidine-protein kinase/phosphatase MprB n=1 Tax=Oryzomicrobium terrae TaxID=1735038 RepID=A0A5C1E9M9_9RHOO|nr:HAMP domain-containing sensor histidine kinase [Oryzomicrobium terrae]QEL64867.1 two-component system, NtrC family, sensor histidine kinase GlrK [Oryzomicrobium terrae]